MEELLAEFSPVSLQALDERAPLLRRVDHKYALTREQFAELLGRLRDDHDVLEIDGRRAFRYASTYFDTPELRCFRDHIEDRTPRFKVRTRLYVDSGRCEFEVKLKAADGETDKHQLDYAADDHDLLTREARDFLVDTLRKAGIEPPAPLEPTLTTRFRRATLAGREGDERLTCDADIRLVAPNGKTAGLRDDLVLVESKSEEGSSAADRALAALGCEPISLSKYRVGIGLLYGAAADGAQPSSELFERISGAR